MQVKYAVVRKTFPHYRSLTFPEGHTIVQVLDTEYDINSVTLLVLVQITQEA